MLKRFFLLAMLVASSVHLSSSSALAVGKNVRFGWNSVPDPSVTGYRVSYGFSANRYVASFPLGLQTSFVLLNLRQGQTVYFVVQSENASGLSRPSAPLVVRVGSRSLSRPRPSLPTRRPVRRPPRVIVRPRRPSRPVVRPRTSSTRELAAVSSNLVCSEWNTAFGESETGGLMWNILRLKNLDHQFRSIQNISLRSSDGKLLLEKQYLLGRGEQRDIVFDSELPRQQTGTVCIERSLQISSELFQVYESGAGQVNYLLPVTFEIPRPGIQSLRWKTFSPFEGKTMSWVSIFNPNSQPLAGSLTLLLSGSAQRRVENIIVPGSGKVDLPIDRYFPNSEGEIIWTPESLESQSVLRQTRYYLVDGGSWKSALSLTPSTTASGTYRFPLVGRGGVSQVLELSNPMTNQVSGVLQFLNRKGEVLQSLPVVVEAQTGRDVLLNSELAPEGSSQVIFSQQTEAPLSILSVEYEFSRKGTFEGAYRTPREENP